MIQRGIAQVEDGDLDTAQRTFERAAELNPKGFRAQQNLGAIAEARGDTSQAVTRYQQAIALAPDYDGLYFNMGYLLERVGQPADAGEIYQVHKRAGRYPYDPKHYVELQQDMIRQEAREKAQKKRGY